MSKNKYIKIRLPKWKWWQITIAIVAVILAVRGEITPIIDLLKIWLKS